jgi:hypothetical protein
MYMGLKRRHEIKLKCHWTPNNQLFNTQLLPSLCWLHAKQTCCQYFFKNFQTEDVKLVQVSHLHYALVMFYFFNISKYKILVWSFIFSHVVLLYFKFLKI